jgi:hypothetical protein
VSLGSAFAAHDTVHHKAREYARGPVHINSAEGFNERIHRTVSGVFHHISPHHADLYFTEIGFRWSQRVVTRQAPRKNAQWTAGDQDLVGARTASIAVPTSVPLCDWTRDAPNRGRRDRPSLESSRVWLIIWISRSVSGIFR